MMKLGIKRVIKIRIQLSEPPGDGDAVEAGTEGYVDPNIHCCAAVVAAPGSLGILEETGKYEKQIRSLCHGVREPRLPTTIPKLEESGHMFLSTFFHCPSLFPLRVLHGGFGVCCSFHVFI
jgi:hypothetical protein